MMKGMKKFTKVTALSFIVFMFVLVLGIQSADATAALKFTDNLSNTITIYDTIDGAGGDSNTASGVVTWVGTLGVFDINVTTGSTYPTLGSTTSPQLDLNNLTINTLGSGTLTVEFSEIGFGPISALLAITTVGGTSDGTTSFNSYYGTTLFDTSNTLGTLGPYVAGSPDAPFGGITNSSFSPSGTYSLTSKATITHSGAGENTSFNLNVNVVPEPISSTLFLVGAGTLGFRRWRKKRTT
jgi:hypothetical protein